MDDEEYEIDRIRVNVLGPDGMTEVNIPIPEQHRNNDCREAYAEGVGDGVIALLRVMEPGATYAREDLKLEEE